MAFKMKGYSAFDRTEGPGDVGKGGYTVPDTDTQIDLAKTATEKHNARTGKTSQLRYDEKQSKIHGKHIFN